jgi:hypothetical protein
MNQRPIIFANCGRGTHDGHCTFAAAEPIPAKFLLVSLATDAGTGKIKIWGTATDIPLGIAPDEAGPGDPITVDLLGGAQTRIMVAGGAIPSGAPVVAADGGAIIAMPVEAGTYWQVGMALDGAVASGDRVEILSCFPQKVVVE